MFIAARKVNPNTSKALRVSSVKLEML